MSKLYTVSEALKDLESFISLRKKDKDKVESILIKLSVDSTLIGVAEGARLSGSPQ